MANVAKSPEAAKKIFEYYREEYPDTKKTWEDFYEKPEENSEQDESNESKKEEPTDEGSFATPEDKPFLKDLGDSLKKADRAIEKKRQSAVNGAYKAFKASTGVTNGLVDISIGVTSLFVYSDPESKDLDNGIKALSKFTKTGGKVAQQARQFFLKGGLEETLGRSADRLIDAAIPDILSNSIEGTLNTAMKYTPMLGDKLKDHMVQKGYTDGKKKFKLNEFIKSAGLAQAKSMIPGVVMTAYKGAKTAMGVAGVTWRTAGRAIKVPSSMVDTIMKKAKTENKPNRGFIEALAEKTKSTGKSLVEPGKLFSGTKSNYRENMSDAFRILKGTAAGWDEKADIALKRQSKKLGKISAPLGEMMDDVVGTIFKRGLNSDMESGVTNILTGVAVSAAAGAASAKVMKDTSKLKLDSGIEAGNSKIKGFTKKQLDKYLAKKQTQLAAKTGQATKEAALKAKATVDANKSLMGRAWGKVWTTAADAFEEAPKNNKKASEVDLDSIQKDIEEGMNKMDDFDLQVFELLGSRKPMGEWTHQDITDATFEIYHEYKNKKVNDEKLKDDYLKYMLNEFLSFDDTDAIVFKKCAEKYGNLEEKNLIRTLKTLSAEDFVKAKKEMASNKKSKGKSKEKSEKKKKKDPRFS